jgi:hypothetical protein
MANRSGYADVCDLGIEKRGEKEMPMQPVKYPNRCLNHLFGYCKKGLKGSETRNPDGSVVFAGVSGNCPEDYTKCKSYVTNRVANPYRPELEGTKLKKVEPEVQPPQAEEPKAKEPRQKKEKATPARLPL